MEKELALFIEDLKFGIENTNRAEDRKDYETYLAYAACMLSKVVLNAPVEELYKDIDTFEKLRDNVWLIDPVKGNHPGSFEKFKEIVGYPGYGNWGC